MAIDFPTSPTVNDIYAFLGVNYKWDGQFWVPQLGTPPKWGNPNLVNGTLVVSASAGALTVAVKTLAGADPSASDPVYVSFRDVTETVGTYSVLTLTAAASLVLSSGSTLGTVSARGWRIWIVGFNDGGTFRLGAINCYNDIGNPSLIYPLQAQAIASSTAEGGAGAADTAHVFYTGTAVSAKAYTVLGYVEWNSSGVTTAGTWTTTNLSRIQLFVPGTRLPSDKVQSLFNYVTTMTTFSTTSYVASSLTQTITPTSAANIIDVTVGGAGRAGNNTVGSLSIFRDSTELAINTHVWNSDAGSTSVPFYLRNIDQANSAASLSYNPRGKASSGSFRWPNDDGDQRGWINIDEIMT